MITKEQANVVMHQLDVQLGWRYPLEVFMEADGSHVVHLMLPTAREPVYVPPHIDGVRIKVITRNS